MKKASIPLDDHVYPVVLGKSLIETNDDDIQKDEQQQQSNDNVFVSFGYEFQPASVNKNTPGLVSVDSSSSVHVLMGSSTGAAGGVNFKGKLVEHKETDCLLLFDGSSFRLERCPFSCMQLRHVRAPTPRRRVQLEPEKESTGSVVGSALVPKESSTLVTANMTGERKKRSIGACNVSGSTHSVGKRNEPVTAKRRQGRPKGSTKAVIAAKKARLKATSGA